MFVFPDNEVLNTVSEFDENSSSSFGTIVTVVDKRSRKNTMIVLIADVEAELRNYSSTRAEMRTVMFEINGITLPVLMLRYGDKIFSVGINPFDSRNNFNPIRTDLMYSCLVSRDTLRIVEKNEHPFMAPQISKLSRNVRSQTATGWTDEAFDAAWCNLNELHSSEDMWNMNSGRERRFSR